MRYSIQNRYQDSNWEPTVGEEFHLPEDAIARAEELAKQPIHYGMTRVVDKIDYSIIATFAAGGKRIDEKEMFLFEIRGEDSLAIVIDRSIEEAIQRVRLEHPNCKGGEVSVVTRVPSSTKTPRLLAFQYVEPPMPWWEAAAREIATWAYNYSKEFPNAKFFSYGQPACIIKRHAGIK